MCLFYFFNLMLEIQALHLMGEDLTPLLWGLGVQSQGTADTSTVLTILHAYSPYSLCFDWGAPRGHRLSLLQIKTASPDDDCICLFSCLFSHCGSFSYIKSKEKLWFLCLPVCKSSQSSLEKVQKAQNSGKIYMPHISSLFSLSECLLQVWSFTWTLSSCSHGCMWGLPLFSRGVGTLSAEITCPTSQPLGAGLQSTHIFLTLHQTRCFSSVSTARKKILCTGVYFHEYSPTCFTV